MKKIKTLILLLAAIFFLAGCGSVIYPTEEEIFVSWGVISNEFAENPGVKARFTIENRSNLTLDGQNWALYYNQTPRETVRQPENATITRISGDWYKLVPNKSFELKPGATIELEYEAQAWLIKEVDAPLGPYFVYYNSKGEEASVVPVKQYLVEPFVRNEQMNRHRNDLEPIPTAAFLYQRNLALKELPDGDLPVITPTPVSVVRNGRYITFESAPEVLYAEGLENEARLLAASVARLSQTTVTPRVSDGPAPNAIYLSVRPLKVNGITDEAYRLEIKADRSVSISGSDAAGVFYGIQSLMALLPAESFYGQSVPGRLPEIVIEDAPRFGFRSLHLDVARNFQSKATVLKLIDAMAFYKLNYFMFQLSEDEAWRIEIDALPELTEVASRRGHTVKASTDILHPSYGSGPFADHPDSYGSGYYTREDYKEIIRYAQQRHITVIPTINLPGHSRAAIRAMEARYNKFMAAGDEEKAEEFRLIDPEDRSVYNSAQSYNDNVVCVARESVYRFFETVIDGIIVLHEEAGVPLEYFHTGGDEVPEGVWKDSPMCVELLQTLPEISDPKNLQAVFFERTVDILHRKGLKIGGWEEVALLKTADGDYVPNPAFVGKNVIPWVWNNLGQWADLSYRLANAGYPVVMCDVSNFYFDLAYNKDPLEPGLYWGGFVDVRNAWQFAPYNSFVTNLKTGMGRPIDPDREFADREKLNPSARPNIVGLQAQLWGETIRGRDMLEYYYLPKLIGFAETAWSQPRPFETQSNPEIRRRQMDEGWNLFANVLGRRELPRLAGMSGGYNYRIPPPGAILENGTLKANVEYPGLTIRYTTDGSEPTRSSMLYEGPVSVSGSVRVKAFDASGRGSRALAAE